MSQYDFGTLDPYVVDGVALAASLNSWRNALATMHRGSSRPLYAVPGQAWCNDAAGPSNWIVNLYVSAAIGDKPLFAINTTTGTITWESDILGGPFLPLGGGTVSGATIFQGQLTAAALLLSDAITGPPTHRLRAQANAANTRIFEVAEQSDGTLAFRALTDDLTTLQGQAKVNRDGSMAATSPASGAASTEVVTAQWVRDLVTAAAAGVPVGAVAPFAGPGAAPAGWLLCAGQAVSRTTYAALWTALGTTSSPYGLGDGSTTFNLPDLRGRAVFGSDAMGGIAASRLGGAGAATGGIGSGSIGGAGGEQAHILLAGEGPNMPVSVSGGTVSGTYDFDGIGSGGGNPTISAVNGNANPQTFLHMGASSGSTSGGGSKHNSTPPGLVLNYIIKY
jgi:microcystin-dependent protein